MKSERLTLNSGGYGKQRNILCGFALVLLLLGNIAFAHAKEKDAEYLYFRESSIAPYQNMREFFDMPNRPGTYEVTLLSDAMSPLTFHLIRSHDGEDGKTLKKKRSFHLGDHNFHYYFTNPKGEDDLVVEVANSNPTMKANVSIVVTELLAKKD